ncbi:MAG: hypothetical protein AAI946_00770 [Candidatus Hodgkinia cicadicola]
MPSIRNGHSITNASALACHFVQSCSKRVWISLRKLCANRRFLRLVCVCDVGGACYNVDATLLIKCEPVLLLKSLTGAETKAEARQLQLKQFVVYKLAWSSMCRQLDYKRFKFAV